jgi:hypothetical protein
MKKVVLTIVAFCICFSAFSQETKKAAPKTTNEIKLNLIMTLFSFPEISYERVWGNNVGLGLSAGIPLENSNTNFQITPYGRFYFGESAVKSFFIEGSMGILGRDVNVYQHSDDYSTFFSTTRSTTDIGLGVAFGYKYVNSYGLIGELYLGLGRTFGDNSTIYPRCGISIGKQF